MVEQVTGKKLDGLMAARKVRAELAQRVATLRAHGVKPGLATVLVGDDPASQAYVSRKHKDCEEVGIVSIRHDLPAGTGRKELEKVLDGLNGDSEVAGYLVQLPLPEHLDTAHVLERIDPQKDADGLHPMNLGRLAINVGDPMRSPLPCTPRGIVELLACHNIPLAGRNVLVIGRGLTVGRPLGLLLTRRVINATVTLAHTGTPNIPELLSRADVVIAAAGFPRMVKAADIKPGAIVLDVGVTRTIDEKTGKAVMVGDVDPDVSGVAAWVSPNPGGVGPMTRAMLLTNVVEAAERRMEEKVRIRH